jgi:hypothetical protein
VATVGIDAQTGSLVVNGQKTFPLGLSEAPPLGGTAPAGNDAWAEIASAGANLIRSGTNWSLPQVDQQLTQERVRMDQAGAHHLLCWTRLGETAGNLPTTANSANEQLLVRLVNGLKDHPALAVWKGVDEPANPNRPNPVPAAGLARAYNRLKQLDTDHPVVIIQAPLGPVDTLVKYRPALDMTGADIYPVSYPPGVHSDLPNKDISVVGDMTRKMVQAAGTKPVWMTLQIAWSGVLPRQSQPDLVPRFPTLLEERFMAYQAIVNGARGLVFFGGDLTAVMRPRDAQLGWNWTFWQVVLRPLMIELSSPSVRPALVAPAVGGVQGSAADVQLAARDDGTFLYVIAVRTSATATNRVTFTHVPRKRDGTPLAGGEVVFEYAQAPLPPPVDPTKQVFRSVAVANDSFSDWFGPHDAHVYRFDLRP